MRLLVTLLFVFFSLTVLARTATVLEVVPGDLPFVKLSNGEVRFFEGKSLPELGQALEAEPTGYDLQDSDYRPTVLQDKNFASTKFERMRPRKKWRSQCYNRAHVWAYEEFNRSGTKLMKNFLFFTNSYIRQYRYKWWFHVAPYTLAQEGGGQEEIVLDYTYMNTPVSPREWTDFFIYSKRECPSVTKYSDYRYNQETEHCYLIKTSMYFWQPTDIEEYEKSGIEKKGFVAEEVKRAHKQAY